MSLLSENVIPGNHGKIFETNASKHQDLMKIKAAILNIKGVKDVVVDETTFPKSITVHTAALVAVKEVEAAVIKMGFHAIPKSMFQL